MRGAQDLGGREGFGPINPEQDEPVFHAGWERRVLGFTVAMGASGNWTVDQTRHEREQLPQAFYWSANYYAIWLEGLQRLLLARGMVTARDLAAERMVDAPAATRSVLRAGDVAATLARGWPYARAPHTTAMFAAGAPVRTRRMDVAGHTRLPAYAWEKNGFIEAVRGCHVYPDSNGMGRGEDARWLYTVRFTARELWGADNADTVCLDLWEPYLDAA